MNNKQKTNKLAYNQEIRKHYSIELAKRGLNKQEVAMATGINYSMLINAINGLIPKGNAQWTKKICDKVDAFLEKYDKDHKK